jgi:glutathione peroxidase
VRNQQLNGTIEITMHLRSLESPITRINIRINRCSLVLFAALSLACALPATAQEHKGKHADETPAKQSDDKKDQRTVYDFSLVDQDGKVVPLSNYKGKLLLIVNLASQSIYSTQIAALNELQKTYGDQGLQIIGIPSTEFGNEELKDPAAMRKYYTDTAHVDFPVFSTATLTGVNAIPLYQFLCDPKQSVPGGDLRWNYTKFLVGRDGKPLARYEVDVDPADIDFHVNIENALAGKLKKQAGGEKETAGGGDDDDDD